MKKFKSIIIAALCFVLGASLSLAGTFAFLKDETETAYNVMTNGNVKIQQLEYERVVDENGKWVSAPQYKVTFGSDTYTPDLLQKFTQGKPLYPAVYNNAKNTMIWDDRNGSEAASGTGSHQQGWAQIGAPGSNQLFDDSVANVIDKFVFVKNTGKYDAYVRTVFAFEAGNLTVDEFDKMMHFNSNAENNWNMSFEPADLIPATIDGVKYYIAVATYARNGGILTPGETTRPSLLQIYLDPAATNETVESFGDTYDVLVISQATQTEGFIDVDGDGMVADDALDRAFGEISILNNPWTGKTLSVPKVANNAEKLAAVLAGKGDVVVYGEIDAEEVIYPWGDAINYTAEFFSESVDSISGGSLVLNEKSTFGLFVYDVQSVSDMTISGNSEALVYIQAYTKPSFISGLNVTANGGAGIYSEYGHQGVVIEDCVVDQSGLDEAHDAWFEAAIAAAQGSKVTINSGFYKSNGLVISTFGSNNSVVTVNGGNFDGKIRTLGTDKIIINGGNFVNFGVDAGNQGTIVIKGGTFDSDPTPYLAEGYVAVEGTVYSRSATTTYTVLPIADEATFRAAMEKLDNIKLMGNISLDADETITVAADTAKVIDLNGYTLAGVSDQKTNRVMIDVRGTLTVKNGTVTLKHVGEDMGWGNMVDVFYVGFNGTLNVENATVENLGGSAMAYAIDLVNVTNVTVNITDSTIKSTYIAIRVFNNSANGVNNVTVNKSTLSGKYAFWTQYYLNDGRTAEQLEATLKYNIFNGTNTFVSTAQPNFPVIAGYNVTYYFMSDGKSAKGASTATELQDLLDKAVDGDYIVFNGNIEGNVTLTQKKGVNITVDGMGNSYKGVFTVFGNGVGNAAGTGLTIKNINFIAAEGAESCIYSPDREVNNLYSYSSHVTVDNCTFTDPDGKVDCAAVRHGDGGDWYWTIKNCTVDSTMHSLIQTNNVHGMLLIDNCKVYSKNGANFNSCTIVEVVNSTFDVRGYCLRFGPKSGGDPDATKTVLVKNNTLKSACDDGDAVIMFRAAVNNMTLTLEGNTIEGTELHPNNIDLVTIVRK